MVHILYVEDEAAIRENFAEAFREAGHQVMAFGEPPDVSTLVADPRPDVYILDIRLGRDPSAGHKLCEQILQIRDGAKVMILSSQNADSDREKSLAMGACAHINKAEDIAHILAEVDKAACGSGAND